MFFMRFRGPEALNDAYKKRGGGGGLEPCRLFSISHLRYTLPSSVSCKSCIWHSYENAGGGGLFFPIWGWVGGRRSIVVGGAHGTTCSAKEPGSPFCPRNTLKLRQVRIRHPHDHPG